jgi:diguanylate cyclase (GGDEF)-like protein
MINMNVKAAHQIIIAGIFLTLVTLSLHPYLPKKTLDLLHNPSFSNYIFSTQNEQGEDLGFWIDQPQGVWGCKVTEQLNTNIYHTCSFSVWLAPTDSKGVNASTYSHLIVDIDYQGTNKQLRISLRNFNSHYSALEDTNSTKFHSVRADMSDLTSPLELRLDEFSVADWWLRQYQIPRAQSGRDLTNILSAGFDFEDAINPGIHKFHVKRMELIGDWISRDNWYLLVISPWLVGILFYAINQLRLLSARAREDSLRIHQLAQQYNKLKVQSDEFRRLSTVDPLTQCFNRFGVHQIITSLETAETQSTLPRYSLIMIDIDYFKRINDRRGHDAGDRVLQLVSEIIQTRIRKTDYLGRWGGEEFIVILPNTTKEFSLALSEKLRLIIYDTLFEPDNPLSVSASFGVAEKLPNEDFAMTFKRVDNALYAAKNQGRNCCVMAKT